jgi:hypothetical protein
MPSGPPAEGDQANWSPRQALKERIPDSCVPVPNSIPPGAARCSTLLICCPVSVCQERVLEWTAEPIVEMRSGLRTIKSHTNSSLRPLRGMRLGLMLVATLAVCGFASEASADQIVLGGLITQSTQDATGPAVNNPALNNILDGDVYAVTIGFTGSITSPGTHALAGATLLFSDPSAPTIESSFSSVSLSVASDGSSYDLSLLGCLTTGSGCLLGNELDANFQIPIAGLNLPNITANAIFGLSPPLDLLEDDGITDIQGSVSKYSYSGAVVTPEPSAIVPLMILALLAWIRLRWQRMRTGE